MTSHLLVWEPCFTQKDIALYYPFLSTNSLVNRLIKPNLEDLMLRHRWEDVVTLR